MIAASKHSAASVADTPTLALYNIPRLYHAQGFVLSSRRASVKKLLTTGSDWFPICFRRVAVDTKLGTCAGFTSSAFSNDLKASLCCPCASYNKPNEFTTSLNLLAHGGKLSQLGIAQAARYPSS